MRAASRQGPGRPDRTFSRMPSVNPAQGSWRRQSRQSSPSARRSAGTALTPPCPACSAQPVTWPERRWRLTVGIPRHLPGRGGPDSRYAASSLRPSTYASRAEPTPRRQASTAKPLRPPPRPIPAKNTRPQPRRSARHTDQSTSGCIDIPPQLPRLHHPVRLARPGAVASQLPSRPCGSFSGSAPNRTICMPPALRSARLPQRGIGDKVTRSPERLTRSVTTLRPAAATRVAGLLHFAAGWRLPGTNSLGRAASSPRAASDGGLRLALAVLCH